MSARVPTSRAYWNLRAEQVMDKVFEQSASDPGDCQLVPVHVAVHEPEQPSAVNAPAALPTNNSTGEPSNSWLIPLLAGVAAAAVVSCGWLIGHWQHSRAQLEQERITLLMERLRERPMAPQTSIQPTTPVTPTAAAPVPEQVTSLKPLTLPIRTIPQMPVSEAAPPAPATPATPATTANPIPQLTGVVQGPGGNSSAIFQIGKASLSAGIGEGIGSSGWVLNSVSDTGAVIERNGERHNLSVGGVF